MLYKKSLLSLALLMSLFCAYEITVAQSSCPKQTDCCEKKCSPNCCPVSFKRADFPTASPDYVIVGCGTGGSVLAKHLSDEVNGEFTNCVVVLETGGNFNDNPLVTSGNPFFVAEDLSINQLITRTIVAKAGDQYQFFGALPFYHSEGRMIGGTANHNFLLQVRGSEPLYNNWAAIVGPGAAHWAYDNVLPFFKSLENYTPSGGVFDPSQRGNSGPLCVTNDPGGFDAVQNNGFLNNFLSQVPGATLPVGDDYNSAGNNLGLFATQNTATNGVFGPGSLRCSPGINIIGPVIDATTGIGIDGRKLEVVTSAMVCRVLFDGDTAIGVEYILDEDTSQVRTIFANKEVILCAGSMSNPAILQRSGVGPAAVLDPLGIPTVFYNDNVGANLKNHYGCQCVATATTVSNITPSYVFLSDGAPYFNGGQQGDGKRRIQSFSGGGPINAINFNNKAIINTFAPDVENFNAFFIVNLAPKSSGTVEIVSTLCTTDPQINYMYWSDYNPATDPLSAFDGSDHDATISLLKIIRDATVAAGETMIWPTPAAFTAADGGDNSELMLAVLNTPGIATHSAGTCKMAASAANGVVDARLRVFGTQRLRCADISVVPIIPDGNTAWPATLIGRVAAALIRQDI